MYIIAMDAGSVTRVTLQAYVLHLTTHHSQDVPNDPDKNFLLPVHHEMQSSALHVRDLCQQLVVCLVLHM